MSGLVFPFTRFAALRPVGRFISGAPAVVSPADRLRQKHFDNLYEALDRNGSPSRVWADYTNLLNFVGWERLPYEVHSHVLRRCTPSSRLLRASAARRILDRSLRGTPHLYEGRFQTIIRNIRASGGQPTLDDYNFILEQFAAVGHHVGAMMLYTELTSLGIVPRTRTFGLCLQAIAHRLTFPVKRKKDGHERRIVTRRMLSDLVHGMKLYNIPFTSVNLDLTMRILKVTTDMPSFESLMKWGYGIDLANPDCPPLDQPSGDATRDAVPPPRPQPFSTAALNTTLDTLGVLRNIPRLVQTFEVLTNPLPTNTARSSYDEEDEDDFGVPADPVAEYTPISAQPNTTTYNILLRHVSRQKYVVFSRHYLLQAMELEKQMSIQLKHRLGHMPLQEIPSPNFAINRGTLMCIFGRTNRSTNLGLMRWLHSKIPSIIRRKKGNVVFYSSFRDARQRKKLWPYDGSVPSDATVAASPSPPEDVLDLDLDDRSTPKPTPVKTFDLDLHLRVLKRDLREIEALYAHIDKILAKRTMFRFQRSARRIWRGRDIYVATEGKRLRVSMAEWEQMSEARAAKTPWRRRKQLVFPWSNRANQVSAERRPQPAESEPPSAEGA
ncbi:hypothetical protein FB45DRAFT_827116 [Roridomyces roridus]|uniref:Uncharacterized protein n=1 Tax=Roridomyces roridus TaxID=1738132 RepID=A0AAD7C4A6_9AGAR|nr:hypothetical protein FB45DRAFT_827116 [Roridomyces roridus]